MFINIYDVIAISNYTQIVAQIFSYPTSIMIIYVNNNHAEKNVKMFNQAVILSKFEERIR